MKLCKRKTDGAIFRPSCPDNYDEAAALADALRGNDRFYFRAVRAAPRRWWHLRQRWIDTGEVWEPKSGEFDVFDA